MKLTDRDCAIMRFINDFGFCEMPHIVKQFGLNKPRNYKVMQRLVQGGYVIHERVFYYRHGIYRLSKKGAEHTGLPVLNKIPVGIYEHQMALIEVYIKLMKEYPDATWISERSIKRDQCMRGIGRRGHVADGMLIMPDGKQIAIEVELTMKGRYRLEEILKGYSAQLEIDQVWYYCAPAILHKVKKIAEKRSMVRVMGL